jgi:NAD(P)H-flavin reductase
MKLRCMTKTEQGWQKETPDDVSRWMWQHDGAESVVVDETDTRAKVYYCGLPSMMETYREAWERERKPNDQRRAAEFLELDKLLFVREAV